MKKRTSIAVAVTILILLIAATAFYLAATGSATAKPELPTPHYISYNGAASKIFLVSATTSYGTANETYITPAGQVVQKGDPLFIITLTDRNDYSADNPPPPLPNAPPISPADGTAYLCLTAKLYDKTGDLNATDVSVSDFSLPATPGAGEVLASGQTAPVSICLATGRRDISRCDVSLIFLGDSILP